MKPKIYKPSQVVVDMVIAWGNLDYYHVSIFHMRIVDVRNRVMYRFEKESVLIESAIQILVDQPKLTIRHGNRRWSEAIERYGEPDPVDELYSAREKYLEALKLRTVRVEQPDFTLPDLSIVYQNQVTRMVFSEEQGAYCTTTRLGDDYLHLSIQETLDEIEMWAIQYDAVCYWTKNGAAIYKKWLERLNNASK